MGKTQAEKQLILPAQKTRRGKAGYIGKNIKIVGDRAGAGQPNAVISSAKSKSK